MIRKDCSDQLVASVQPLHIGRRVHGSLGRSQPVSKYSKYNLQLKYRCAATTSQFMATFLFQIHNVPAGLWL